MRLTEIVKVILSQVATTFSKADVARLDRLKAGIAQTKRIFVAGQGRTGLIAKTFAMRLGHLGLTAHVVGETTTPAIAPGDLLIACSGTGAAQVTLVQVELANQVGARTLGVTWAKDSLLARACDEVVVLPVQEAEQDKQLKQFGGALFEQALLVYFDALAAALKEKLDVSGDQMRHRHANLE